MSLRRTPARCDGSAVSLVTGVVCGMVVFVERLFIKHTSGSRLVELSSESPCVGMCAPMAGWRSDT